jgi:hypothetical protein
VAACVATGTPGEVAGGGCHPKGGRTVVKNRIARIFAVSTRREVKTYGCLFKEGRSYLLARQRRAPGEVDATPEPRLAGRFVAYRWTNVRTDQDYPPFELRVFDLGLAVMTRVARYPDTDQYAVPDFVVNRRGAVGWTSVNRQGANTPELMDMRVHRLDDRGETLLDFNSRDGTYRIEARSLAIHDRGRLLEWVGTRCRAGRCAVEPRTADLR